MIFSRLGVHVLALSVDSPFAARAFAKEIGLESFPLLGDLNKEVCRRYGLLRPEGFSERVTYLLDEEGVVRYRSMSDLDQERDIADYLQAIEAMSA